MNQSTPSAKPPSPQSRPDPMSSTDLPTPEPWGWDRRQRVGLGCLLVILLAFLIIQFVRRPYRINDPLVIVNGESVTLPQRIDPNIASAQDLARIPHLGETLAGKIIQYRDARKTNAADGIVFREPADLDPIPGIGKKLIDQLKPFLKFPDDAPDAPAIP